MIIQCPDCNTRFKLADEKIKPGGIKVRCSKCKHIFAVSPPAPAMEAVQDASPVQSPPHTPSVQETSPRAQNGGFASTAVAAQAKQTAWEEDESESEEMASFARQDDQDQIWPDGQPREEDDLFAEEDASEEMAVPEGAKEAGDRDPFGEFTFDEENADEGQETSSEPTDDFDPSSTAGPDPLESQETFSSPEEAEDEAGEAPDLSSDALNAWAPPEPADSDPFALPDEETEADRNDAPEAEFSLEEEEKPVQIDAPDSEAPELSAESSFDSEAAAESLFAPAPEESSFDSDFFTEPQETEGSFEFDLAGESEDSAPLGNGDPDFADSDFSWGAPVQEDPFEEVKEDKPEEDTEGEDFDFSGMTFGEEDAPRETLDYTLSASTGESIPSTAPEAPDHASDQTVEPKEAPAVTPRPAVAAKKKGPMSGLLMFLLLLLLLLSGLAAYLFWKGGQEEITRLMETFTAPKSASAPEMNVQIKDLQGTFVTNTQAGQLFAIHGEVVNESSEAWSSIAIKGVLYNAEGQPVLQQTVFAGNPLTAEELKELSFSKIEESMNNQFGNSLANLNISPGKSIPFTIVFKDLPTDLSEFTVEVAESNPGAK